MRLIKSLVLLGLFWQGALAVWGQEIHYNYDRGADFAAYKTYQWVALKGARVDDPFLDQNIKRAVDGQLAQKGMRRVEEGGDLFVAHQTSVKEEKEFDAWTMGPRWSGRAQGRTYTVQRGTLVLHLYDPARKQLVWRGSVSKTLNLKKDPEKNYQNLEKAVAKLLKNYPPTPKD